MSDSVCRVGFFESGVFVAFWLVLRLVLVVEN